MHEWYLEHVEIPIHVILSMCLEKLCQELSELI